MNHQNHDRKLYAQEQFNLGFSIDKEGNIEQARKHWNDVLREDDKRAYAYAQLALVISIDKEGNIEHTRKHWNAVLREDDKEAYGLAQFALGVSILEEERIEEAKPYLYNFLNYRVSFQDGNYSANLTIYNYQKIITCLFDNHISKPREKIGKFYKIINKIHNIVINIQEKLYINPRNFIDIEKCLAHYTKVEIAEKIIKNGSFQLGVSNYMNDPTEGKILLNKWKLPLDYNDNLMAFLTSFTFNENSLNQFRLYGKQDGKDGSGLSLVINHSFFDPRFDPQKSSFSNMGLLTNNMLSMTYHASQTIEQNRSLQEGGSEKKEIPEKLQLFRCIYMYPDKDYVSIAHRSKLSFYGDNTLEYPEKIGKNIWKK